METDFRGQITIGLPIRMNINIFYYHPLAGKSGGSARSRADPGFKSINCVIVEIRKAWCRRMTKAVGVLIEIQDATSYRRVNFFSIATKNLQSIGKFSAFDDMFKDVNPGF